MGFWKSLGNWFGGNAPEKARAELAPQTSTPSPVDLFLEFVGQEAAKLPHIERFARSPKERFQARAWLVGHAEPTIMNLDRLFQETRELAPEGRSRAVARFLSSLTREREELTWDDAITAFVPVIRLASFASGAPFGIVYRPFLPFVRLFAGIDRDDSTSFVTETQLKGWGQKPELVFELALATLARHVRDSDVEPYDSTANSGIWHVTANDSYEPSRLALPGYLESFRGRVPGNPIAILPDRARLLIGGDGEPNVIARLARMAETEFNASTRAISCAVYTVASDGTVQPLHLPSEHPHHALVERGHRLLAGSGYADQKSLLQKRFDSEEVALFVASLGLFVEKGTGHTRSWASFAEGVDALLPEADLIAISGGKGNDKWTLWATWENFFELAPGCLERDPEHDPPRWLSKAWPDESQLNALRAISKRPGSD